MCCDILPAIIGGREREKIPVVMAKEIRTRLDELKRARVVVIDDLGKEPRKHYGETDNSFLDLCEASVQGGPLLIISTCLSTSPVSNPLFSPLFPDSIEHRYGAEVLDRLKAIVTTAVCYEASVRTRK
jgi:DNA replication protein DnaC